MNSGFNIDFDVSKIVDIDPQQLINQVVSEGPTGSLFMVLGIGILLFVLKSVVIGRIRRRGRDEHVMIPPVIPPAPKMAAAQALADATVAPTPLLNRTEAALYGMLRDWMARRDMPPMDVYPQVSLARVFSLKGADDAATDALAAHHVNFLLVDAYGMAQAAVDYHDGLGDDPTADDAATSKAQLFSNARIPLVDIRAGATKTQVFDALDAALGLDAAPVRARPAARSALSRTARPA